LITRTISANLASTEQLNGIVSFQCVSVQLPDLGLLDKSGIGAIVAISPEDEE
jgi:hypothetical protein